MSDTITDAAHVVGCLDNAWHWQTKFCSLRFKLRAASLTDLYRQVNRPSASQHPQKQQFFNVKVTDKCPQGQLYAIVLKYQMQAPVALLSSLIGPTAVRGPFHLLAMVALPARIMTQTIDAVQGHVVWALAYVADKVIKRVAPSITDTDTRTSIPRVRRRGWVIAPILHAIPHIFSVAHFGRAIQLGQELVGLAPARLDFSSIQMVGTNGLLGPALAATQPNGFASGGICRPSNDGQPMKLLADKIFELAIRMMRAGLMWCKLRLFGMHVVDALLRLGVVISESGGYTATLA